MSALLDRKIALVTAGTKGLGLAIASKLARDGFDIAVCGRNPENFAAIEQAASAAGSRLLSLHSDLTDPDQSAALIPAVLANFGRLDLLVLNSGHMALGNIETLTDAEWSEAFELLLMSAVRMVRATLGPMERQGVGDIIFVSSATIREPSPNRILSTVMRLGLAGLAKSVAATCAAKNIRVNTVAPGFFDTGRVRETIDNTIKAEPASRYDAGRRLAGDIPIGRLGDAEELAEVVSFIASRRATYLTGTTISVDGGGGRAVF